MLNIISQPGKARRALVVAGSVIGIIALIGFSLSLILGNAHPQASNSPATSRPQAAASPLLFGTNLDLLDSTNPALSNQDVRETLQTLHLHIIRLPVRADAPSDALQQAVQYVKDLGALPLLNLRGLTDSAA